LCDTAANIPGVAIAACVNMTDAVKTAVACIKTLVDFIPHSLTVCLR
jgi:hypothetical protein